jgi:hypothetical protein
MRIVDPSSLAATVDNVNDAHFYGTALSKAQREEAAKWIAGRQGLRGSYAGMFAPTEKDFEQGSRVFTGERIRSYAGTAHILGEEACRALILLSAPAAGVRKALADASAGMIRRLRGSGDRARAAKTGMYCCGTCSASLWRHLAVGGLENAERLLAAALKTLKANRDGGRWGHFPFYYTLLALSEIPLRPAIEEMRYAAPSCERLLKRRPKDDKYDSRRRDLAERILGKC